MDRILIATSNAGKLRDFAAAASRCGVSVKGIPNFASLPEAIEDAPTFETNAQKKAEHYSGFAPGEFVLADDSGLEVDVLHGAPGIYSARYAAGPGHANASDAENNAKLLRELESVEDEWRKARFVCAIAVARNGKTEATFRGSAAGTILRRLQGSNGFGYDPLFFYAPLNRTFAELTPEEKCEVSHRGEAFRKLLQWFLDSDIR